MTTTTVTVPMSEYGGRVVSPDMFADLGVGEASFTISDDCLCVQFKAVLSAAIRATVADRLTSRDDADQTARAELTALLTAAQASPGDCAASHALTVALTVYLLDN
jgi:hypothetical protein